MPLIRGKSPKSFSKNVATEMDAGKSQPQSLAIAYSMKRHAAKKKMAQGGMVPTDKYAEDMLDSHPMEHKAEQRAGSERVSEDTHEQRSDDMLDSHPLMGKPERRMGEMRVSIDSGNEDQGRDMDMTEGRKLSHGGELRAASMGHDTVDSGDLDESRDMEMLDSHPSMHSAEVRAGSGRASADDALDMIDTIMMKRKKMAQGGMVDHEVGHEQIDQHGNQDESKNLEDDLSFDALHDPMQDSMIDGPSQPMDSNEHGDEREKDAEDEHDEDMIDVIMKRRKK